MKQTIDLYQFRDAFQAIRPENFSYEGLELLYYWFEECEQDAGEDMELDVIAICCDWAESTVAEIMQDYGYSIEAIGLDAQDLPDEDEIAQALLEHLADHTSVAGMTGNGTIVYCSF